MSDFPLQPTMVGGAPAPIEGETTSAPNSQPQGGFGTEVQTSYDQSPVAQKLLEVYGHFRNPTPVSHDAAVAIAKKNGLDPAFVPQDGMSQGALQMELERQSDVRQNEIRIQRSGGESTLGGVAAGAAAGILDPSSPVVGVAGKAIMGTVRAGMAARLALGAAEGATYNAGMKIGSDYMTGHEEDMKSWDTVTAAVQGAAFGGLAHTAFGARPLASPGENLTTDTAAALENSAGYAKAHGNMNPNDVISATGAVGIHQVEPSTARLFGMKGTDAEITEQLKDPAVNKQYAKYVIEQNAKMFPGDPEAQAIAYNDGPLKARSWIRAGRNDNALRPDGTPLLPAETKGYLARLRGTPMGERVDLGRVAAAQFASDNDIDVQPFTKRSALTLDDDHADHVQDIFSEAQKRAWPDPYKPAIPPEQASRLSNMEAPPAPTEADATIADARSHIETMDPEQAPKFDDALKEAAQQPEVGTLKPDELTKAVKAAVQCGAMKGLDYASEL